MRQLRLPIRISLYQVLVFGLPGLLFLFSLILWPVREMYTTRNAIVFTGYFFFWDFPAADHIFETSILLLEWFSIASLGLLLHKLLRNTAPRAILAATLIFAFALAAILFPPIIEHASSISTTPVWSVPTAKLSMEMLFFRLGLVFFLGRFFIPVHAPARSGTSMQVTAGT